MTDDHHHRTVRIHLLGHTEIVDAVVGDQIREVVLERGAKPRALVSATKGMTHIWRRL